MPKKIEKLNKNPTGVTYASDYFIDKINELIDAYNKLANPKRSSTPIGDTRCDRDLT